MNGSVPTQHPQQIRGLRPWLANRIHGNDGFTVLLLPLAGIYGVVVRLRRLAYAKNWLKSTQLAVPVIVVGNLSVGGTGKSPVVRAIVAELLRHGLRPGIVARGYRGRSKTWPRHVVSDSDPLEVGDEAVEHALLADAVGVMVGPSRVNAANALIDRCGCDVIVADDGLQHLAMQRDVDIAVIDGEAGFGNGYCLPAGPLREPASVLAQVDHVVVNGQPRKDYAAGNNVPCWTSQVVAGEILAADGENRRTSVAELNLGKTVSVSGIGNPVRFETMLQGMGVRLTVKRRFPDHHMFEPQDFEGEQGACFLMTLKDAVKCRRWFAQHPEIASRCWYVGAHAELDPLFLEQLATQVIDLCGHRP